MKTEDELDADIAKLFDEVTTTKVETVNGNPKVTDEQTIRDMEAAQEMENAIADITRSFRDFTAIMERGVNPTDPLRSLGWWKCLQYLALADCRLKEAFICGDRSPASIRAYAKFRSKMLEGKRYRPDA
jgi:hypothetical protein